MISMNRTIFIILAAIRATSSKAVLLSGESSEQINSKITNDDAREVTLHRRGQVGTYNMTLDYCEANLDDFDASNNIACKYDVFPSGKTTTANLYGVTILDDNYVKCEGDPPSLVSLSEVSDTNDRVEISIDKSQFNNTLDIEFYRFCVSNNVVELLGDEYFSMFIKETVIDLTFNKDGGIVFGVDVMGTNLGGAGYDEGETLPGGAGVEDGNLGEGGAGTDREAILYEVISYQCDTETYAASDELISQGSNVGLCVETQDENVLMNQIESLLMVQLSSTNDTVTSTPISDFQGNAVTATRCDLANFDGQPNSKCFIQTSMLTKFFGDAIPRPVGAGGQAEIIILNNGFGRRAMANINFDHESVVAKSKNRILQRPDTQLTKYTVLLNLFGAGRSRGAASGVPYRAINRSLYSGISLVWVVLWCWM